MVLNQEHIKVIDKFHVSSMLTIGILVLLISCIKTTVEPEEEGNLLPNGSFEFNGKPTLDGWRVGNQQLVELVNEAAPDGGSWALKLTSDRAPTTGFVYTPVTKVNSGDIVKLSAYVRATGPFGGAGFICLAVGPNVLNAHRKEASSTDTVWTEISIIDTVNLTTKDDTLWVVLSSPRTEIVPFQQLFDRVRLNKVKKLIGHYDERNFIPPLVPVIRQKTNIAAIRE